MGLLKKRHIMQIIEQLIVRRIFNLINKWKVKAIDVRLPDENYI